MEDRAALLNQLRLDRSEPVETRPSRWLWWALGALVVLALSVGGWFAFARNDGIAVRSAVAQPASTSASPAGVAMLDASGYVVARRQATVAAKITGKVVDVLIDEGQRVEANQIIAKLDDTNAHASLAQAQAQLAQARANRNAAKIAFDNASPIFSRSEKQITSKVISAQDFDTAKATYDASRASLEVAERSVAVAQATLSVAQRNLDDTTVRAPFAGVVTVKAAQPGEIISPMSAGGGFTRTGIGTIVDMDSLEVEVDVSESFINRVHADQPATVKLNAYPDWSIPAAVIAVIPTADRAKATVKVRVGFKERDERMLPEMGARVSFLSTGDAAAPASAFGVVVPAAAVDAAGDTGAIFVIHDDNVERRSVRLGAMQGDNRIVLSGVEPGTQVAIGDFKQLSDGSKIRIDQEKAR
jgi:RND family efflux transporter MFP subunit